ncbi:MAG TPA: c-type cytochrome [Acidiferrobacteraceae bacterium]|nr:c-type cytochrome [Acidiferrobacteraceae bacterium]
MGVKWTMTAALALGLAACSQQGGSNLGPKTEISPSATTSTAVASNAAAPVHKGKASISHANLAQGQKVFEGTCSACHGAGIAGAPRLGDKQAWAHHIAKGNKVLLAHAENGFTGKTGTMPARGGNPALSNQDVADAIAYMKSKVQ